MRTPGVGAPISLVDRPPAHLTCIDDAGIHLGPPRRNCVRYLSELFFCVRICGVFNEIVVFARGGLQTMHQT
jgi:hypothetical protein